MDFEFTGTFHIEEEDIEKIIRIYKSSPSLSIREAFWLVADNYWAREDYYLAELIVEQAVTEIKRKIGEEE